MEEAKLPYALNREIFERVWRRVMPEDRPDSPIVLLGEEPLPWQAPVIPGQLAPAVPTTGLPVPVPAPVLATSSPAVPDDDVPCLGAASAVYGGVLQQYIDGALAKFRLYHTLSRRTKTMASRMLATMAADERRHAKRLSTAYFLISGVRYWPPERSGAPYPTSLPAILRQCFADEQRTERAYLMAAENTCDPALRELYLELAGDEGAHSHLLRSILEQL